MHIGGGNFSVLITTLSVVKLVSFSLFEKLNAFNFDQIYKKSLILMIRLLLQYIINLFRDTNVAYIFYKYN
jgi:hypothetical protein